MFLQQLVGDEGRLLQGALRIAGGDAKRLAAPFAQITGGWAALGAVSASLRASLDTDGELSIAFFLAAPESQAAGMRRLFARLLLLDGVAGARIELASDKAGFEAMREDWPGATIALDSDLQTAKGTPLLCRGVWPDLIAPIAARMSALGARFSVHVNATPATPPADAQKAWGRALVDLDSQPTPAPLRQHQHGEFADARAAHFNIETFWGTSPDFAPALVASLDAAVQQREPALRQTSLHASAARPAEQVIEALHTFVLAGDDGRASHGALGYGSQAEASLALAFPQVPVLPKKAPAPDTGGERFGVKWSDMPPVADRDGFAFISYAHSDAARVYDLLKRLGGRNVAYWYDRGIPCGEQWDDELESRLSSCSSLLAFLSPRSVSSRYCRREIKYADILGKPILPVMLENTRLDGGLSFILSSVQYAELSDPHLLDRMVAFLEGARP
jgi:hypothetical protein